MYVKLGVFIMMGFLSLIPLTPVPWLLFEHIVPLLCFLLTIPQMIIATLDLAIYQLPS